MTKCIEVDVYGHRLALQPVDDERYAQELARYVDGQMQAMAQGLSSPAPAKIAMLVAMNLADQLFQRERLRRAGEAEIESRAEELLDYIVAHVDADGVPEGLHDGRRSGNVSEKDGFSVSCERNTEGRGPQG